MFVIRVGESAEISNSDRIRRARDVLLGGPNFHDRVVEFVPELNAYRVFRNKAITMFWDLTLVDPSDADDVSIDENSVLGSCSSNEDRNTCTFVYHYSGYVVRHTMPERYAKLNERISKFVIQNLEEWRM